ncbi:MAG TPA: energy transducer TonB [Rudaea sp.]|jgi:protein TonB|nr:energy transducer TonB [Rudaea sp.]
MKIVPIVIILIGAAIAAYFFFFSNNATTPVPVATKAAPATPGAAAAPNTAAPAAAAAPAPELTKEQLLKEAGTAFREQRYVAPPGNNALEYYLRVLDKEPNNASARDALREGFPFFTGPAEQYINAGNVEEANRVIDLLTKVDPNNFTLNILRSKLDAKKKQVDHDQQVASAAAARAAAAPAQNQNAQNAAAAPATAPTEAATTPAQTAAAAPKPAATPAAPPPAPVQAPTPAPAPAGESHAAELVRAVQPDYPPDAYRSRAQGWVEVEFTVGADGAVSNAQVVTAEPSRIFNSAAINAVKRWTFKPKMENGKAVEEQMRRRIEFKLGA